MPQHKYIFKEPRKPLVPYKPHPPEKIVTMLHSTSLEDGATLSDVVPASVSLSEVNVAYEYYDRHGNYSVKLHWHKKEPNINYDKEYRTYERKLKDYKEKLAAYKVAMVAYKKLYKEFDQQESVRQLKRTKLKLIQLQKKLNICA